MRRERSPEVAKHAYAGIRFRIAIVFVLLSLIPMFLVVSFILYQFTSYSNEMVYAHVGELVLKHQQDIDSFNRKRLSDIRHLSRSFAVERFRDSQFLHQRLRVLQDEYGFVFVDLGLVDERGTQVSYAGMFDLLEADYGGADWFRQAMAREDYISDVFLGLRGHPHFIVAVRMESEGVRWLLRATIDFVAFNTLVENLRVGRTGTAYVVNRSGEFQTRPPVGEPQLTKQQFLRLFERGDDSLLRPGQRHDGDAVTVGRGAPAGGGEGAARVFTMEKSSREGDRLVIVASFLKSNEWLLVFQQEHADAFSKLRRTQRVAALISFLGSLAIVVMALVVSGRIVRHMARLDFEKAVMNRQVVESGKLASIGELAAGIAHEINNPVAIMVEEAGWCEDLMDEGMDDERLAEFRRSVRQIQTQGRRCKEITHKLLSFARKTDARVGEVQLNDVIQEVVGLLSQKARYANVEVDVELAEDLPVIRASVTEMQQVLMNMLHNAVDAMAKTGGRIHVRSRVESGMLRLSVADTGPGIPAVDLERIFDPFFTTKPVGKGTGLGLSICYGIVKKMGGRIDVESQVGKGATFHVLLPLDDGEERDAEGG